MQPGQIGVLLRCFFVQILVITQFIIMQIII